MKSSEFCIKDKYNNSSYNLTVTVNIDPVYKCVLFALFLLDIPKKYWPVLSVGFLRSTKKENRIEAPVSGHPGEAEKCLEMAAYGKNSCKRAEAV